MHTRKMYMPNQEDYRSLMDDIPSMVCCFQKDGTISYVNKAYCDCYRFTPDQVIGQSIMNRIPEKDHPWVMSVIQSLSYDNPLQTHDHQVVVNGGKVRWQRWTTRAVFDEKGRVVRYRAVGDDVTVLKQHEQEQDITLKILSCLHKQNDLKTLIQEVTTLLQNWSGCDAVGIRLKDGDDYPYYETRGFAQRFVNAENSLCTRDPGGDLLRDPSGNPVLECMCGNVIEGRFDPSLPFFTGFGSFWTNSTTELLSSTTEKDRQAHTIKPCNREGYESVALIPLRVGDQKIGLLQCNDIRRDMFRPQTITNLERLALHLALGLSQRITALALEKTNFRNRAMFDQAAECVVLIDPDSGTIVDFNAKAHRDLGYSREEFARLRIRDFDACESRERVKAHRKAVLEHGTDTFETRHMTKDGRLRDVSVTSNTVRFGEKLYVTCFWKDITERKRAEAMLRAERDLMERITDTSPAGIVRLDSRGLIVYANKRVEELVGVKRESIFQKYTCDSIWKITDFDGNQVPRNAMPFHEIKRTGKPVYDVHHAIEMPDGRRMLLSINAAPLVTPSGEFDGVVLSFDDVTERYRTKKDYQMLFNEMIVGFALSEIICDEKGRPADYRILAVNPAFERQTGLSTEGLVGHTAREIMPHIEDSWIENYGRVALTGEPMEFENYSRDLGRDYHVTAFCPAKNHFACTFMDITKRKEAESALKASHERFTTVLDGIESAVYVADLETYEILFMNSYMIKAFGRDMTGEICWKSLRNELRPCPYCTNDQLLDESRETPGLCVWQDENPVTGQWFINQDRIIKWTDGRRVRIQIATDITEMKALEARLQQAQKLESIGNLASGIAHDFNNILFPIMGMSEMLLEELHLDSPERKSVVEILKAGKRGSDLVKQILSFSRNYENRKIPVKVQQVLTEVLSLIRSTIPSDTDIHMDIDENCVLVMAAPTQIHQIAMNLITNAYHAVEGNGGHISVRLDHTDVLSPEDSPDLPPGRYVRLSVSDTGHGIEPSHLEKIFDPYFTTKSKGTGLGLSVVYGIVKDHKGDIQVASEPGRGTTFTVRFPAMDPSTLFKPVEVRQEAPKGDERILLVDDEAPIVAIETRILEKLGYTVYAYTDSQEALSAFTTMAGSIDLVITDMTMPGINGADLAGKMMAVKPEIPVILCTGFSERIDRSKAEQAGIRGFVMKPVVKYKLACLVREVLDKASDPGAGSKS